jgi:hypothetical protein
MGDIGFGPATLTASKTPLSENLRTESGTVADDLTRSDPTRADTDLAAIVRAWPHLPESTKLRILDLAKTEGAR